MISLSRHILYIFVALFMLSACGGGSEGGIGGSGISTGIIQDQTENGGSKTVTVNDVTFDTSLATFSKDGVPATAANFNKGMVVAVQGSIDANRATGTANSMSYASLLAGPISAIDTTRNTLTVMAQTVIVDASTLYNNGAPVPGDLKVGDAIEVSGFFTDSGMIYATYIEKSQRSTHEIKGVISALTPLTGFAIGNLQVSWFDTAALQIGDFVQASGSMSGSSTLLAGDVQGLNRFLALRDADDAEIEGLATTACTPAAPPCSFQLGFITVRIGTNTEYEGGVLADLQPGTRLEVEGTLVNNVVLADEIKFKDKVEIISDVSALDMLNNTFTLDYGNTDVTVNYDPQITRLDSIANFAAIQSAGHVKVRARVSGSKIVALRIENSQGNKDLALQGTVSAASNPSITILGVAINTNSNGLKLKDRNGLVVTQSQFFAQLTATSLVKAKGKIESGVITWQEIKIQK